MLRRPEAAVLAVEGEVYDLSQLPVGFLHGQSGQRRVWLRSASLLPREAENGECRARPHPAARGDHSSGREVRRGELMQKTAPSEWLYKAQTELGYFRDACSSNRRQGIA